MKIKQRNCHQYDEHFFNVGSSLLIFGSKKLYRKYLLYREISTNPLILNNKNFEEGEVNLFLLGSILKQIRKEIALEINNPISEIEALSFFVNGFANNPLAKVKYARVKHQIRMFKLELFLFERWYLIYTRRLYYMTFAPIFGSLKLLIKYLILIPIGKLIKKVYPNAEKMLK